MWRGGLWEILQTEAPNEKREKEGEEGKEEEGIAQLVVTIYVPCSHVMMLPLPSDSSL